MSKLRQRFLNISRRVLNHIKSKGFKKKGAKCYLDNDDITYLFIAGATNPWSNSEEVYLFNITFGVEIKNPKILDLYNFIEGNKKIRYFTPLWMNIAANTKNGKITTLTNEDHEGVDDVIVEQVIDEIDKYYLPLIDSLNSVESIIKLLEDEYSMDKKDRFFYRHKNIYMDLEIFYAYKGWKQKTIEMLEEEIKSVPITASRLVEKNHQKYLQYFKENNKE